MKVSSAVSPVGSGKKATPPQKQTKKKHKKKKPAAPSDGVTAAAVQKTVSVDKLTGEVEEDEDCSAEKCLKPTGQCNVESHHLVSYCGFFNFYNTDFPTADSFFEGQSSFKYLTVVTGVKISNLYLSQVIFEC